MLVLSRKVGERIEIGGGVTLIVTRVTGNRVVIGIEAPRNVGVRRGELSCPQTACSALLQPAQKSNRSHRV